MFNSIELSWPSVLILLHYLFAMACERVINKILFLFIRFRCDHSQALAIKSSAAVCGLLAYEYFLEALVDSCIRF